jgi:hypothetical protein
MYDTVGGGAVGAVDGRAGGIGGRHRDVPSLRGVVRPGGPSGRSILAASRSSSSSPLRSSCCWERGRRADYARHPAGLKSRTDCDVRGAGTFFSDCRPYRALHRAVHGVPGFCRHPRIYALPRAATRPSSSRRRWAGNALLSLICAALVRPAQMIAVAAGRVGAPGLIV